ncbi:MAG TPA: type III-B CRISPR module RAMP protein Cmr6 [Deltaproteobacteria bacterium]|nr:type III-B CRISPR module RAMP protein Cmr6 [Deltaproteobacteria bacterium]
MQPIPGYLRERYKDKNKGNFGLFLNKFIHLDDKYKVPIQAYNQFKDTFKQMSSYISGFLTNRQFEQSNVCESFIRAGYEKIVITARLSSPLIVGLGESHPSETGIFLDHNMGIPYIPASSIKGVVRLAHTIGLLKDDQGMWLQETAMKSLYDFDPKKQDLMLENDKTNIPAMFGRSEKKESSKGGIIFLDAYPADVPRLKVDIMNPHYSEYYSGKKDRGPTDDQMPVPIKFLVVDKGAEFVFRALVKTDKTSQRADLAALCRKALRNAVTEEGIGAKTALGYGRFDIVKWEEPDFIRAKMDEERRESKELAEKKRLDVMSEEERLVEEIHHLGGDSQAISGLVKRCFASTSDAAVFRVLRERLQELGQWKPSGSKQRKQGMKERNDKIEQFIAGRND